MTLPVTLTKAVEIEDPNLILTVEAKEKGPQSSIDALMLPHNRDRYIPPEEPDDVESREVTPYSDLEDDNNAAQTEQIHQLRLTFDRPPTDIGGGFSFGTDKQACDVLLAAKRRQGKISGVHFYITFDEEGRLILLDTSTQGTAVSYGGWGRTSKRHHFKWILFPGWKIQVHLPNNFTLDLVLPKHQTCDAQYRANVTSYLEEIRDAPPPLSLLDIQSRDSTALPTEPLSPRSRPIYLPSRMLGQGSFGKVVLVTDVSTANVYAAKVFREGAKFQNEVRIMRSISHRHIVPFVDFVDEHPPQLIMEYLPLGNLEQEHKRRLVTSKEAVILFYQCLQALGHLHANNVTHRDLKPANILVESRDPFRVKLCDFGLAKVADNDNVLKTFCGTFAYCAPEIYLGGSYSPAVDIWSLGVIILEYEYGYDRRGPRIPGGNRRDVHNRTKQLGLVWCEHLVEQANDWDSDPLIDLLSTGMLKIEPKKRLSAAECIGRVKDFEPSVDPSFHPGSITSTPRASPISGDNGDSTIKGRLWVSGVASGDGDNCWLQLGTPAHASLQRQSVSHLYNLSVEHSEFNNKSSHFHTMYDGVLALLKDLLSIESANQNVDDNASAMVRRLCECLTSLNITKMAVHNESHIITITATSNNREMVVANLISSEMMNSIEALAGHLLHKLQFQSPQTRSTREFENSGPSSPSTKHSLTELKELISRDAQVVAEHVKQGCHFQADDYFQLPFRTKYITIRKADCWLNATQILAAADLSRAALIPLRHKGMLFDVVRGGQPKYQGTYVNFEQGLQLCQSHDMTDLSTFLVAFLRVYELHLKESNLSAHWLPNLKDIPHPAPTLLADRVHPAIDFSNMRPAALDSATTASHERGVTVDLVSMKKRSRSVFTEPSYSNGPYLPPTKDRSYLPGDRADLEYFTVNISNRRPASLDATTPRHGTEVIEGLNSTRKKPRSVFTEPSYSNGSYLPPVKDCSYLRSVHPHLETPSVLSLGYGSDG